MNKFRLCVPVTLTMLSAWGWSDDTAITGISGVIRPMKSHPSVVLRSQVIKIKLSPKYADVDCTFVLHNTGKATSVLIGFPEEGYGTDVNATSGGFAFFRSFVDGKPVKVRVHGQKGGDREYSRWYVKRVYFRAGQTRVIRNIYRTPPGGNSIGNMFFIYTLSTGASWKGPIGRADIIVELKGIGQLQEEELAPKGYQRVGNKIIWRFRNIEPTTDIYIPFFPFYRLFINGDYKETVYEMDNHEGTLLMSAYWLRAHLNAQVTWDNSTKSATIIRGDRQIVLRVGSREAIANGQRIQLPAAPRIHRYRLFVPIRAVITALGGKVHHEAGALKVTIAQSSGD
jgi:hypothetical protein